MIDTLLLKNFKCFEEQSFAFGPLTVLTGINGMGKSTILQSLLLLRQSSQNGMAPSQLLLNGAEIEMGIGEDVLYEKAKDDTIEISYQENGTLHQHRYRFEEGVDRLGSEQEVKEDVSQSVLYDDHFCFISAYRIEPKDLYGIQNRTNLQMRQYGRNGEFALQYLNEYGGSKSLLPAADGGEVSLQEQVAHWMNEISPGVIPIISVDDQKRRAELHYEFIEGTQKTNTYKSIHVGFGITYVLPIIVAMLSARKGDVIVLENPEAHIHPRGQRKLGELMALVVAQGVQILVETHSDHVLNGIRVAVKREMLDAENVKILYFYKDNEEKDEYRHKVKNPRLLKTGQLTEWPDGFFDEWENALLELL